MTQFCINPDAIEDWELEDYADGEALPQVAGHLARCPACREKLATIRAEERLLQQKLYRFDCPSPAELNDYYWRSLPGPAYRQLKQHLRRCPHCAAEMKAMSDLLADRQSRLPAHWSGSEQLKRLGGQIRLYIARLLAPDMNFSPVLRGETQDVLLFETEGMAISAHTEPEGDGRFSLFGQLLATAAPLTGRAQLQARQAAHSPPPVHLDAAGAFKFSGLRPDAYQLLISLAERHILIPHLVLK